MTRRTFVHVVTSALALCGLGAKSSEEATIRVFVNGRVLRGITELRRELTQDACGHLLIYTVAGKGEPFVDFERACVLSENLDVTLFVGQAGTHCRMKVAKCSSVSSVADRQWSVQLSGTDAVRV